MMPGRTDPFRTPVAALALTILTALTAASEPPSPFAAKGTAMPGRRDIHSHANPHEVAVRDLTLELVVDFERKRLQGSVELLVERTGADAAAPLVLDTKNLAIEGAEESTDGAAWTAVPFKLGGTDPILGTPLSIPLSRGATKVRVTYGTGPEAAALQWLAPAQTSGKKHPFLFTQSQAINARSWIPLQDSPGVRVTYSARVRTLAGLTAVMSAETLAESKPGEFRFRMPQAIPSYLIALAVGDLAFEKLGPRSGVYAEPSVVKAAASEFRDLESMITATEKLYGPYRWGRYDVLVLPPSFPFGGMENPRITFATPTILAGDRSLVGLIAHELAHSWSGNLVTNATWADFWLNEGFTVHLERRILEQVFGPERAEREAVLGRQDLESEMRDMPAGDRVLRINLAGRDPDDNVTSVPYEKGALFLAHLERTVGRDRFDAFLKEYFDAHAFRSITTDDFLTFLKAKLLTPGSKEAEGFPLGEWIDQPDLPATAPRLTSASLERVGAEAAAWLAGTTATAALPTRDWSTQEWLHFLRQVAKSNSRARMADLDAAFKLTSSGNSEIAFQWLLMAIRTGYEPANARLEDYLTTIGRRKLVRPLYEELAKSPAGLARAKAIYAKARPMYHPITAGTLDKLLGPK